MLMPLNVNLVGCMGYDWQAQIAELPDALISSLSRQVIPALEVCRLRPGAAVDTYSGVRVYIDRAQDVVENCQTQRCTIVAMGHPDRSLRCRRAISTPTVHFPMNPAEPVIKCNFFAFLPCDE
jgi:hypothetical protein